MLPLMRIYLIKADLNPIAKHTQAKLKPNFRNHFKMSPQFYAQS